MNDFPQRGDNFAVVGIWRIGQGRAWHDWQRAALAAQIRAAEAAGEPFEARRLRRERDRLTAAGPDPVRTAPDADTG